MQDDGFRDEQIEIPVKMSQGFSESLPSVTSPQELREIWRRKKILRKVYEAWYRRILSDLSPGRGRTLEVASGIGNFKDFLPTVISSDIDGQEWLDMECDAHCLPVAGGTLANVVMIDGLHHLTDPLRFLDEAARVLAPGGRVLLLEPYPSLFSLSIYRRFHHEPFVFTTDYFSSDRPAWQLPAAAGNQAAAYLIFFKFRGRFQKTFSNRLRIVKAERLSCLAYPLSGGFRHRSLLPAAMLPFVKIAEALLYPLRLLLAFRCYIVLEKT